MTHKKLKNNIISECLPAPDVPDLSKELANRGDSVSKTSLLIIII